MIEYVEPSAIGVRANYSSDSTDSAPTGTKQSSSPSSNLSTPHAMIRINTFNIENRFPEFYLPFFNQSQKNEILSIEIDHPPA